MTLRLTLGEVFDKNRTLKPAERVAWLQKNATAGLLYFLKLALTPDVTWLVSEGTPEYRKIKGKDRPGAQSSDLFRELRRMYVFLKGGGDALTQEKRNKLFASVLEGIDEHEVALLVAVKDRKFEKQYACTKKLVEETFPGLLAVPFSVKFIR